MDTIITQVQSLAASANEAGRKKLIDSLRNLQYSIETPNDTLRRFGGLQLQIAAACIGIDLGIFEAIHESKEPLSISTLAEKTGAQPELLGRILRHLAAEAQIMETSKDHFSSSPTTAVLADKAYQGGIHHFFDTVGPVVQHLPDFLEETKWANIEDCTNTPLQKAFNTNLPGFVWFPSQTKRFEYFQQVMTVQRAGAATWLSAFPLKQELNDFRGNTVFVDIGGSFGHQCIAVKQAFPELAGKLVLQDLPETLAIVGKIEGVEVTEHNFFETQPVKGAKFYYLRNILHNWPDEKAIIILKNIIPALGEDSRILIDEMVLPNEKVHWHATQIDLAMMSAMGAKERTDEQWRALIDKAGLKIINIVTYTPSLNDSIIMAIPK